MRRYLTTGLRLVCVPVLLLVLGLAALTQDTHGQETAPNLRLTPTSGRAGTLVLIEGEGFSPNGGPLTVFWNDQRLGVFQMPPGNGTFREPFLVPAGIPVGKHVMRVCAGDPCPEDGPAIEAAATFQVESALPGYTGVIGYVYDTDRASAEQYKQLLTQHGFAVDLIPLGDVVATKFSQFDLVMIGPDTGKEDVWANKDPEILAAVAKLGKVMGIGMGGHAFFGARQQPIGYPNGITGSTNTAIASDPGLVYFRNPYDFTSYPSEEIVLFEEPRDLVAVLPFQRSTHVIPILHPTISGGPITDAVVAGSGCSLLWGFGGGAKGMTPFGQALFVNAVAFLLGNPCSAEVGNACQLLTGPGQVPAATVIGFDELSNGFEIGDHYGATFGVRFEMTGTTKAQVYSDHPNDVGKSRSAPNVATNSAIFPNTSSNVPMRIKFDRPQSHAGMWIGNGKDANGNGPDVPATLIAMDEAGRILCRASRGPVPASHEDFIGLYDEYGRISELRLTYGGSILSESIDDLTFGPFAPTNRIRVCRKGKDGNCVPVPGAQVYHIRPNAPTNWVLTTDPEGYLNERGRVRTGDGLWPTVAVSATMNYTLFHTAENPYPIDPARFTVAPSGDLEMYVSAANPLMVFDIQMTTQWSMLTNDAYIIRLIENIQKAANYLYDFTDGQIMLGRVDVYQNYDNWDESDVWIFSSNSLRPSAAIGGIVDAPTADPVLGADQSYYPGHVFMGRTWNRFGEPGIPPHLAAQVQDDWSLALAHEFGHYLLFLFDTYLTLTDDGEKEIRTCTGSAMGWVYEATNTEFVADETHWATHCGITLANQILNRTEWATIRLWYDSLISPAAVNPGPAMAPVPLTKVFVHPPSNPAVVLENQTFALNYQNGETASGEARAFIFRNGRVLDQGKPFPESTEIALSGAQTNDRFCVFDVNDFTDDDAEEPRHQFGCETLAVGDNTLEMEADDSWAPIIEVRHFTSVTVGISVTQQVTGAQLMAQLYPEHSDQSTKITLTSRLDNMHHFGIFESPIEATSAYIELWVEEEATETNPRRATVVDFGTGGTGAHGPAYWYGGVPVVSSDGKAEFSRGDGVFLEDGHFIALQSMAGTPRPPTDRRIIGQAYRLVALPETLAKEGHVALRIRSPQQNERTSVELPDATVFYWTGEKWIALETVNVDDLNAGRVALAPSQGVGIYVMLIGETSQPTEQQIYLPHLSR